MSSPSEQNLQNNQISDVSTTILQQAQNQDQNQQQKEDQQQVQRNPFSIQSFTIYTLFSIFSCYLLASLLTVNTWLSPASPNNKTAISINSSTISSLFNQETTSIQFSLDYSQITNFSSDFFSQIKANDKLKTIEILVNTDATDEITSKLTKAVQNNSNVTVTVSHATVNGFVINFGDIGFCYTGVVFSGYLNDIKNSTCFSGLQLNNFMAYGSNHLIVERHAAQLSDSIIYGSYENIKTINTLLQQAKQSIEIFITQFNPQPGNDILTILLQKKQENLTLTLHANPTNFANNIYFTAISSVITPITNDKNNDFIIIDGKIKIYTTSIAPQQGETVPLLIQRFK